MKIKVTPSRQTSSENKYSITGLTRDQFDALRSVIVQANQRCFEEQDEDGGWYSNDDFVCLLSDEERQALRVVAEHLMENIV